MVRSSLLLLFAVACYTPTPHEGLACSEQQHCPQSQMCDPLYHECGTLPMCRSAPTADRFDTPVDDCGAWGRAFGFAASVVQGGVLSLTPTSTDTIGGCQAGDAMPF